VLIISRTNVDLVASDIGWILKTMMGCVPACNRNPTLFWI